MMMMSSLGKNEALNLLLRARLKSSRAPRAFAHIIIMPSSSIILPSYLFLFESRATHSHSNKKETEAFRWCLTINSSIINTHQQLAKHSS